MAERPGPSGRGVVTSAQRELVFSEQGRKLFAGQKSVLAFALVGERIEAKKDFVDEAGMAHHDAFFRQALKELAHQEAEIRLSGKIVSSGKAGIDADAGAGRPFAELRAQDIEKEGFGRGKTSREL